MIDSLGDVGAALASGNTGKLADLYTALGLRICYEHETGMADVMIQPATRVNSECVRGGIEHFRRGGFPDSGKSYRASYHTHQCGALVPRRSAIHCSATLRDTTPVVRTSLIGPV